MSFFRLSRLAAAVVLAAALTHHPAQAGTASAQSPVLNPGPARAGLSGGVYTLGNRVIEARWTLDGNTPGALTVTDKLNGKTINLVVPF